MNEDDLRALVRDAIARHAGAAVGEASLQPQSPLLRLHPSHGTFALADGAATDGPCLIEAAVMCNHCGYCKSYGH